MMQRVTPADRQKAKLVMLFCALGLVGFLLNAAAAVALWGYSSSQNVPIPTYDRFVNELHATEPAKVPELARRIFERWSACEATRSGMSDVAVHGLASMSVVGLALFALCFILSLQLYHKLNRLLGGSQVPQPPDPVDDNWPS
jgi:hypothetical protein